MNNYSVKWKPRVGGKTTLESFVQARSEGEAVAAVVNRRNYPLAVTLDVQKLESKPFDPASLPKNTGEGNFPGWSLGT